MIDLFSPDLGSKSDAVIRKWRRRQLEISWLPRQSVIGADFWKVTGEALDEVMAEFGVNDFRLRARMMEAWLEPTAFPEAQAALARLKAAGIKSVILSNGSEEMLAAGLRAAGLTAVVDAVLSVQRVGVFKPDPAVYKLVTDWSGCEPEAVWFISGNAWDISGAAGSGFRGIWLNRTGERADNPPRGAASAIGSLAELPALLGV